MHLYVEMSSVGSPLLIDCRSFCAGRTCNCKKWL